MTFANVSFYALEKIGFKSPFPFDKQFLDFSNFLKKLKIKKLI